MYKLNNKMRTKINRSYSIVVIGEINSTKTNHNFVWYSQSIYLICFNLIITSDNNTGNISTGNQPLSEAVNLLTHSNTLLIL